MDDIVKAAIAKWPNVPNCFGWLGLDARGNRVEQGGFARARFAHHRQHLAGPEIERGVVQHRAIAVAVAEVAHAQQRQGAG